MRRCSGRRPGEAAWRRQAFFVAARAFDVHGVEGTGLLAVAARDAPQLVDLGHVARGCDHRHAVLHHRLEPAAAAGAAVADGEEPVVHRVLEARGVHVPPLVLGLQQ